MNSNKWYQNKFNKEKPSITKNIDYRKRENPKSTGRKNTAPEDCTLEYSKDSIVFDKTFLLN